MEELFIKLLNYSIMAGWLVLAIMVIRLVFKKAPKWIICLLWALVAIRLVLPFSIESALSLIPSAETVPQKIFYAEEPRIQSGFNSIDKIVNPYISVSLAPSPLNSANQAQVLAFIGAVIWGFGVGVLILYTLISTLLLKVKLRTATLLKKGIKQSEVVGSPFVLGMFRPVIYLPYKIDANDIDVVIAHEQAHIKRRDHWWKPFGFLLLTVYWFNPLMWIAYIFLCRDIEAACDEKVIREMGIDERRVYATALLNCSVHRRRIAACPLAFGETGVKGRIKSVINYKKPAFWVVVVSVSVCIVVGVCFLTNPKETKNEKNNSSVIVNNDNIDSSGIVENKKPDSYRPASVVGKYSYNIDDIWGDFIISINEDGTFSYGEGIPSSYIGIGTWEINGDVINLYEEMQNEQKKVYSFNVRDDSIVFNMELSSKFSYVTPADGQVFQKSVENSDVITPVPEQTHMIDTADAKKEVVPIPWYKENSHGTLNTSLKISEDMEPWSLDIVGFYGGYVFISIDGKKYRYKPLGYNIDIVEGHSLSKEKGEMIFEFNEGYIKDNTNWKMYAIKGEPDYEFLYGNDNYLFRYEPSRSISESTLKKIIKASVNNNFVILNGFNAEYGQNVWKEFYDKSKAKIPCEVTILDYFILGEENSNTVWSAACADDYPSAYIKKMIFDGSKYTLKTYKATSAEDVEKTDEEKLVFYDEFTQLVHLNKSMYEMGILPYSDFDEYMLTKVHGKTEEELVEQFVKGEFATTDEDMGYCQIYGDYKYY